MKPVLIMKTGMTVQSAFVKEGDFERWIIDSMPANDSEFIVVEVFRGEKLPPHDSMAGVVITGSPSMVTDRQDWSEYSADWLRHAVVARLPILGICYGHQLLAHALGGQVDFNPGGREIGTTQISLNSKAADDPLFKGVESPFAAQVSHMQSVTRLPAGSTVLGSNDFDPCHAVRFSDRTWGIQFHPEFSVVAMKAYIEERQDALIEEGMDVEELLESVEATPVSRKILEDFYRLIRDYSV